MNSLIEDDFAKVHDMQQDLETRINLLELENEAIMDAAAGGNEKTP